MSPIMRKLDFCISENKGPDQLCTADQRLCLRYSDSTISLILIANISRFQPASVTDLCHTRTETPRLFCFHVATLLIQVNDTN